MNSLCHRAHICSISEVRPTIMDTGEALAIHDRKLLVRRMPICQFSFRVDRLRWASLFGAIFPQAQLSFELRQAERKD